LSEAATSPYHPQSNGACERFNGSLKSMIRSLFDRFPDSWDTALPWVLFELERYMSEVEDGAVEDALKFWQQREQSYPLLASE